MLRVCNSTTHSKAHRESWHVQRRLAWRTAKSQEDSIAVVRHGTSVKNGIASHKAELAIASNKAEQYSKTMRLRRLAAATAECLSPRRRPRRLKVDEQK